MGGTSTSVVSTEHQVEVSTPEMVGTAAGPYGAPAGATVTPVTDQLGVSEGAPLVVVVADTSPAVAEVRATFPDGSTDVMRPVDGWVALAGASGYSDPAGGVPLVTLTATSASGQVLQQGPASQESGAGVACCGAPVAASRAAIACPVMAAPAPQPGAASGSGASGASQGSAGSTGSARAGAPTPSGG